MCKKKGFGTLLEYVVARFLEPILPALDESISLSLICICFQFFSVNNNKLYICEKKKKKIRSAFLMQFCLALLEY